MSITREKRLRRAELFEIRKIRCRQHRTSNCPEERCRIAAVLEFYGRGKKGKPKQAQTSPLDLDQLFYLITHPQTADDIDLSPPPENQAPAPSAPALVLVSPENRTKTLRQLIAEQKLAA
jgi:hypothetical protein